MQDGDTFKVAGLRARGGRVSTNPANPILLSQQPLTQGAGTPSDVLSRSQPKKNTTVYTAGKGERESTRECEKKSTQGATARDVPSEVLVRLRKSPLLTSETYRGLAKNIGELRQTVNSRAEKMTEDSTYILLAG